MQIFSRNCFGRTKHRYIDKHLFPSSRNSIMTSRNSIMTEMRRPATPPGLLVILPRATLCYIPQLNHTATAQLPHLKTINVINLFLKSVMSMPGFKFFPKDIKLMTVLSDPQYDSCKFIANGMELRDFLASKPRSMD